MKIKLLSILYFIFYILYLIFVISLSAYGDDHYNDDSYDLNNDPDNRKS